LLSIYNNSKPHVTSWLRSRLSVHLSAWGGQTLLQILDHETRGKASFLNHLTVSSTWHCWYPCHTCWQQLVVLNCGRHQEINKHLTFSTSANQIENYWFLLLFR
jgi:hypothetical protein